MFHASLAFLFLLLIYLQFPQLVMQAIVDLCARFRDYDLGWPGSVNDSTVFKESDLWRYRHIYFGEGEYILVDKGFGFA